MDRLQNIKYKRMKPEERFLFDILNQVKMVTYISYPDSLFYIMNGSTYFEYNLKRKTFWIDYYKIFSILLKNYKCDSDYATDLIKKMAIDNLKLTEISILLW